MDTNKELEKLITQFENSHNGVGAAYRGGDDELSSLKELKSLINEAFKGYQCETVLSKTPDRDPDWPNLWVLSVRLIKETKRATGNVTIGKVRRQELRVAERRRSATKKTEFGILYQCPICMQWLPREAFGSRSDSHTGTLDSRRRQSYCYKCHNSYTLWRKKWCKEHGILRLTPEYGPKAPNEIFRAYRLKELEEQGK